MILGLGQQECRRSSLMSGEVGPRVRGSRTPQGQPPPQQRRHVLDSFRPHKNGNLHCYAGGVVAVEYGDAFRHGRHIVSVYSVELRLGCLHYIPVHSVVHIRIGGRTVVLYVDQQLLQVRLQPRREKNVQSQALISKFIFHQNFSQFRSLNLPNKVPTRSRKNATVSSQGNNKVLTLTF